MSAAFAGLVAQVHAVIADSTVASALGEAEVSRHGAERKRVVWVWRGGRLMATTRTAYRLEDGRVVRPLFDDEAQVDAWIRAESADALEDLWLQVLTATRRVFGTGSRPGEYFHQPSASTAVSGRSDARELVQRFVWRLSVCEQQLPGDTPPTTMIVSDFATSFSITP